MVQAISVALTLVFGLVSNFAHADSVVPISFNTSDYQRIDADLYRNGPSATKSLAIVAPGFAQHRHTQVMQGLCSELAKTIDTLCFDFRGTGTSTGYYTFGQDEPLDLEPILNWAAVNYTDINVIGLSLGAYTAGRAAYLWPDKVSKLLLISCPTDLNDIILSGGFLASIWASVIDWNSPELRTGANWFFRWGNLFAQKPDLSDMGSQISTPASFLSGENDHLVFNSLSQQVYDSFAGEKTFDVFELGGHAEAMFVQNPQAFEEWIVSHLKTRQ